MTPVPKPAPRAPKPPKRLQRRTPLRASAKPKPRPSDGRWSSLPDRKANLKPSRGRRKCYEHLTDKPYRRWIMSLPCLVAGRRIGNDRHRCRSRVEPAHLDNQGQGGVDRGNIVPLCGHAHRLEPWSYHMDGPDSFAARFNFDLVAIARELGQRYELEAA
jgi:hypothetical protein